MTKNEILTLIKRVRDLQKSRENTLPNNSYFLSDDEIVCYQNRRGDSRYPYYNDGLTLFAHSDGYIDCVEGDLDIFKCAHYNEDAYVAFFAGEKTDDGFFPISVTGAAHQLFESGVNRYTVFTPVCAYYVAETEKAIYVMRVYVDDCKHLRFSVGAVNLGEEREIYLCSYFEPMLRTTPFESYFARMTKYSTVTENSGFVVKTIKGETNCLAMRRKVEGDVVEKYQTTAKNDFIAHKGGNLTNALSLKLGKIESVHLKNNTTDISVACDMLKFKLGVDDFAEISYEMALTKDADEARMFANGTPDAVREEQELKDRLQKQREIFSNVNISFKDWQNDSIDPTVLNKFLKCVRRQISLCALGKNYAGSFLGIRDVFQQLEMSLLWQPAESRAQIVKVMNYILEDGRAPRQIVFVNEDGQIPKMDLRPFIDQGLWIISALHTYVTFTDDFSILDEICGYYRVEETYGPVLHSDKKDSILDHLKCIMDFLISNIDVETSCLRALYGDWNDALDGLGRTKDVSKEFGSGVSVMATLQLYLSFELMCQLLDKIGGHTETVDRYKKLQNAVAIGIENYALLKDDNGFARMAHGWGDERSYYVGSFNDYDGASRISLTANSFGAISGIMERFPEYKTDIVKNITSLNCRFGLLTFDKPFSPYAPEIGRLSTITPGTYENACTYVHAGTFGAMALFLLGEPEAAWNALEKAMVISHDNVTMTTFVMPNSYCIDGEFNFNGESMGDWHTGSGAVLIKNIIKLGFGVQPMMDRVRIAPATYFPTTSAMLTLPICGKMVTLKYEDRGIGTRQIYFDGNKLDLSIDAISETNYAVVSKKDISDNCTILILD